MKITQIAIDYHRNGVAGVGFYVILFHWKDVEAAPPVTRRMLATVFPEVGVLSVLDIDVAHAGTIAFFENSWRGDNFEPALRQLIRAYERTV